MNIAPENIATRARIVWATSLFVCSLAQAAIPVQHWTQASGAQVFLVESPAIAMLDVQIDFDAGSRRDPAAQAGLASLTAAMLDKGVKAQSAQNGGLPALDENALSEAWADLGAQFGASAGADRMGFSLRSLTDPALLDKAVALAARQIAQPSFPDAVWQRERQRVQAALKESDTRPGTLAGKAFSQAVYGAHPYGYQVTGATLAKISVADMQALHASAVLACRARISMVGAVNRAQADAIATRLLAGLPPVPCASVPPQPAVAEVAALVQATEKRIAFDSAQAHVLLGQPGFKRDDPDYFALTVGNYILGGGGFVSRLSEEVRQKRGLSYSVYSYFSPALHAGAFAVGLQTRPDQAAQALAVSRDVIAQFVRDGPTEAELKAAKSNLVGGFALRIDSNRKLLDNLSNIAWNNLALDYLDSWTRQVQRITAADIQQAFARKLQPQRMVTVVVGGSEGGGS